MTVLRTSILVLGAAMACAAPGSSSTRPVSARPRLDSATIERLCVRPERVQAGWAECVLKDQSPPIEALRRLPPAP
jgi:hypothetical protein